MAIRTNYTQKEFEELLISKMNENSENKPTFWGLGSVAKAIMRVIAYFNVFFQLQLNICYNSFSIITATGMNLVRRLSDWGLNKRTATFAATYVTFYGKDDRTDNMIIPSGTIVKSVPNYFGNSRSYVTVNDIPLLVDEQEVKILVICTESGTIGNTQKDTITILESNLSGIDSINNLEDVTNGSNEESDEEYRGRLPDYINGLKVGNESAILSAAYSVEGVKYARIVENHPANGVYSIYISTEDGLYDSILIQKVYEKIKEKTTWCVSPLIVFPTLQNIVLSLSVQYDSQNYNVDNLVNLTRLEILNNLNNKKQNQVLISDIITLVKKIQGVKNVKNVKVNNVAEDLILDELYVLKLNNLNDITVNVI